VAIGQLIIRSPQPEILPQQAVQPIPLGQHGYAPQPGLDQRQILQPVQDDMLTTRNELQEIENNGNIICKYTFNILFKKKYRYEHNFIV